MRITYRDDYALKTILELSLGYGEGPLTIHELAGRADIPLKFLEQILLDLKRGGFVESRRGQVGGYLLARPPADITLGQIIRFIEGDIEPIACVNKDYKGCDDKERCVFRGIWQEVAGLTSKVIDNITFADLAKRAKGLKTALVYEI